MSRAGRRNLNAGLSDGISWRKAWRESITHANRQLVNPAVERDAFQYFLGATRTDTDQGRFINAAAVPGGMSTMSPLRSAAKQIQQPTRICYCAF